MLPDQATTMAMVLPTLRRVARSDRMAGWLNRPLAPFNPLDPRRHIDPYPIYESLRAHGPVYNHTRIANWLITGYEECEQVLRAPVSVDRSELITKIPPYKHIDRNLIDMVVTMMLMVDPPDHTRLRKLVNRAFTPRAIAQLEPQVEKITDQILDELEPLDEFDVMHRFASQVPIYMIGSMLGVDAEQWPRLHELSDTIAFLVDPLSGFDVDEMAAALSEATAIFRAEFAKRRINPQDDIMTALVNAEEDGDRLSERELESMCLLLMVAGHETTSGLIGNALVTLSRDHAARRQLIDAPELAANATEEFLRHDSPVQNTDRVVTEPLEVGGHVIPAGAVVTVLIGAANRDPRVYTDPAKLQLDRPEPHPFSFGQGIHYCLGAALARMEGRIAIRSFVERFPEYRVDQLAWKRSTTLRGPANLTVTTR